MMEVGAEGVCQEGGGRGLQTTVHRWRLERGNGKEKVCLLASRRTSSNGTFISLETGFGFLHHRTVVNICLLF